MLKPADCQKQAQFWRNRRTYRDKKTEEEDKGPLSLLCFQFKAGLRLRSNARPRHSPGGWIFDRLKTSVRKFRRLIGIIQISVRIER